MTFWGFLFAALIVFVALYAWYRFRNNRGPADLGGMVLGEDDRHMRAQGGHVRRSNDIVNANRPLLVETGEIGKFDDPVQNEATVAHHAVQAQKTSRDLSTQLYLSEIGSIGDVTRQPVALLPAPHEESGAQGMMKSTTQMSAQSPVQRFRQGAQGSTQSLADQEHAYSSAVSSESVGSNLSQSQSQQQSTQQQYDAQWLENSDLERLNNAGNVNNHYQGANFDATYGDNAASTGSYMQAQSQSYQTEVGTIGEQEVNQAPRDTQRRGYIHKSDVEFGSQGDMEGLYNLPDQLPVLNNTNFNDPNCK